ncbi:hypothetical protein GCK32_011491 [Trichostrongylus colubriformis]|uniref:GRIP domain-containing protein n=1 Tax=Trichostrongylus colubriformis TaxID=6319 RepID=A0AAN8IXF6_TRICO
MNARDLQKKLESQHDQIKLYEKKLKDVVRAYKSLETEKTALQNALDSISPEVGIHSTKWFQSLQAKLQQVDVDRERELVDHGKVLAEMQARYAKEHQSLEATSKETTALTKKINQKDELINQLKSREAQLICQVSTLNKEVKELTEKAYDVPSIQILKDELANLKVDHARELMDAVVKAKHMTQLEEQDRASAKIAELEEKTMSLLETVARSEEARNEAYDAFLQSEMEKATLVEVQGKAWMQFQFIAQMLIQIDYRLREVEQAALVKELEHHKKTEAMSEEITKLQNKLALLTTGGELEYLRNIFIQFIQSNNSSAKKNILKAMGMALKLSANEMKAIDSK